MRISDAKVGVHLAPLLVTAGLPAVSQAGVRQQVLGAQEIGWRR